ncbi:voltage-dependent calcium channel subunit alpha-2/delta-3 isoform X2 [Cotesia glomerata]|uniref:voltage-dependent calcium channel subunit alpha-2/delta-3 isoform X2 n=1 Tax=Cotesia glomerata TaxID=32391 RepID=UPI001D0090B6|nr:voltage-dependent calcium channel subunit alpha-2/delta-3 isoform X2 [Cotesia glomerata]
MKECLLPILFVLIVFSTPGETDIVSFATVKTWAHKLGFELSQLGKYVTNVQKFEESYKQADVKAHDGSALVHEIAKDIKEMMESKISAIRRIMDIAETSALSNNDAVPGQEFQYVNAKNNSIEYEFSRHFGGEVNITKSAVHVPTNVYDRAPDVIRAIKWSEELDQTFINNYEHDPSISWQYFGSVTGFMRQYPATTWNPKPVDLFDCRTRGWYIEAATSPKDILILVDVSGSMTGIRREIARHVVNNILDTLGNNDFVNIILFSNETHEVVPCFNDTLVQANLANVRELKEAIETIKTDRIANFSLVLTQSFRLLERFRLNKEGAACNQAIMLITDGVPYNYKEIFQEWNWNNTDEPDKIDMPVRVFTYLIGREVTDVREVKWMACANRGYYVHLSTYAEVREQVLNYVPVMARPLVLRKDDHPTIWTPVYADITDPKMTDWLWEQKECEKQKELFLAYRRDRNLFNSKDQRDRRFAHKPKKQYHDHQDPDLQEYQLMTSVSIPVFDRRKNANITEMVLIKEAYWVAQTRESRVANLLGVAGTDVPIQEIQKLMMPHMLGVNGHSFIVTNNGYVLIHPDLRPVFQGILKPSYNAVDMAEVELMDSGRGPREFDEGILTFRDEVIDQLNGSVILHTKYHYDDMKRVGRVKRKYDYTAIDNTPFTLVVSLPEHGHGSYRVHATEEIHRAHVNGQNATDYFADSNWRIHPDWIYCKYHYEDAHKDKYNSSEQLLVHFLTRTRQPGWFWSDRKLPSQPPEYSVSGSASSGSHSNPNTSDKNSYYCDRVLLQSLVHDAKVTEWFANINQTREEKGKQFQQRFGFTLAFMATHSGLTRWQDFPLDDSEESATPPHEHFSRLYPRAIDEIWYKRAVEQYYVQPDSFVFSVPLDEEGADNTTLVTASRAIFIGQGNAKAPAAVVGFQFQHTALRKLFHNITSTCDKATNCPRNCNDSSLACYLIDNNGYVIASKLEADAGKFFGQVRGPVMNSLVDEGIFNKIRVYDYQGVCFKQIANPNCGSVLFTPIRMMQKAASWLLAQLVWTWAKVGFWQSDYAYGHTFDYESEEEHSHNDYEDHDDRSSEDKGEKTYDDRVIINRTKPQSCDKEVYLYLLKNESTKVYDVDLDTGKGCTRPYVVQPVDFSNMLLIVVDLNCPNTAEPYVDIEPVEVIYFNTTLACQKASTNMKRRRPLSCIRNHLQESEIKDQCGLASTIRPNSGLLISIISVITITRLIRT